MEQKVKKSRRIANAFFDLMGLFENAVSFSLLDPLILGMK
jgi:hypothetical protein